MIYLKNKKVCFLEKPKCGSTSLRRALINKFKNRAFISNKNIVQANFNYNDPDYIHCNLDAAIKKVELINGTTKDVIFISTIRDPISLINSMYYFDVNTKKNKKYIFKSIEEMIKTEHYKRFTDESFFKNHESVNLKVYNLKDFKSLEKYLFDNFNIKISFSHHRKNSNNKKDLILKDNTKKRIMKDFSLFF